MSLKTLLHENVVKALSSKVLDHVCDHISDQVKQKIKLECTQTAVKNWRDPTQLATNSELRTNKKDHDILNDLLLSPHTCAVMKNKEIHFGACKHCHDHLKRLKMMLQSLGRQKIQLLVDQQQVLHPVS